MKEGEKVHFPNNVGFGLDQKVRFVDSRFLLFSGAPVSC